MTGNIQMQRVKVISAVLALFFLVAVSFVKADEVSVEVDFTLADLHNNMHSLSDYRGRWVIVNFWATWCAPCIKEIPDLIEISRITTPVQPVVIGIDFEEIDLDSLTRFIESMKMDYLVLLIGEKPLIPFEPLKGMPSTFIVSPEGHLVSKHIGAVTKEVLLEELTRLVSADTE